MTAFSYQLYSSRNFGPLERTLTMLRDARYAHVEGYGAMFADTDAVRTLAGKLDGAGLTMPTAHIGLETLEQAPDVAHAAIEALKLEAIFVPYLMPEDRPIDADGWSAFGARLAIAGEALAGTGVAFGWHNHDFEFERLADGTYPIEALIAGAPNLQLELDLAWVRKAGEDPVRWIEALGDQIVAAHVKDIAADDNCEDEDGWADVGHGIMDWPAIVDALSKTGCRFLIIEHDNPSDDARFAQRSIAATRQLWSV